jgi:hypothetical protein
MFRRLAPRVLALLALLASPDARALAQLEVTTAACTGFIILSQDCEFLAPSQGAGATSSILRTWIEPGGTSGRSASATVTDFDHFSASAGAGIDYTLGPPAEYPSQLIERRGVAFARIRDSLVAGGAVGTGTIRLQWALDGANSLVNDAINPLVVFDILNQVILNARCDWGATPSLSNGCGAFRFDFEDSGPANAVATFDLPITFGAPIFFLAQFELHAITGFRSFSCDDPCIVDFHGNVDADFSSTGQLVDVQLFDGAGNELDPSLITSESGFRYDLVGQDVPEPLALALAAPLALAAARRRRA